MVLPFLFSFLVLIICLVNVKQTFQLRIGQESICKMASDKTLTFSYLLSCSNLHANSSIYSQEA